MIKFQYGRRIIRFRWSYLRKGLGQRLYGGNGEYRHNQEPEEEYIDLVPILRNLYIDASQFLKHIKEVRLVDEQN